MSRAKTVYNDGRTKTPFEGGEHSAMALLEATGDRALPDVTLSEAQRMALKSEVHRLATRYSSYELVFLSSALEFAANRKRAEEGRRV